MSGILSLMWTFFKIGLFTFGGGYAMIPLIISELTSKGFVTNAEIVDIIAVSQVTPGTFALNAATFSGVKTFGVFGGVFATLGVMLPSIILATLMAKFYIRFKDNRILKNTMYTLRPIVLGLISSACILLIPTALFKQGFTVGWNVKSILGGLDIYALIIAIFSVVAMLKYKVSPIIIVFISGFIGVIVYAII